ncbi:DNA recombination protein RmuC [Pseudomaricurvus alkylphenolicus]|uniref:DNA recombination protein RmuC n=1 Tax=Pseudomaricurvus alkylphenolicus TaxID=1306991 RepID=UPI0014223A8D|nr:DNA recombination protein RmuC [Pseudomaricurvus alkylphenolicus]NIB41144.1 DNA recombination protein RmuC [Pseudomaricurvus alkylphenolicus]
MLQSLEDLTAVSWWLCLAAFALGIGVALVLVLLRGRSRATELALARQEIEFRDQNLDQMYQQKEQQREELDSWQSRYRELQAEFAAMQSQYRAEQEGLSTQLQLLQRTREQMGTEFQMLANRIFDDKQARFQEQSRNALNASVEPLREQLQAFRRKVEDAYEKESAERNQLLGQVQELQKQTRQMGEDAINLTNALKGDNKAQGNWGEMILERLLEQSGLERGREYLIQAALKTEEGQRRNPDVVVRLPHGKDIVIDSKVSLVDHERAVNADSEAERSSFLASHVNSVRTHIQQLGAKNYEQLQGLRSLDFVFMFVPVESAFMSALQSAPSLYQEASEKGIFLVSPTTLLASLRTVENIWRTEKQNRNAESIARQAGGLHDQFVLLLEALDDTGRHIQRAQEAWQLSCKRLSHGRGNLLKRVDDLRQLGAKTGKQIPQRWLANDLQEVDSEQEGGIAER